MPPLSFWRPPAIPGVLWLVAASLQPRPASSRGLHVCLLKGHAHCSGPALILYKLTFILALTSSAKTLFLSVLVDVNLEDTMQLSTQS